MDERAFLSLFDRLVEGKSNPETVEKILSAIDQCKGGLNDDMLEGKGPQLAGNKKKAIIRNRKYAFKLTTVDNELLQYTLDRLVKGISSGNVSSQDGFSDCLGKVMGRFGERINFAGLVSCFLSVYSLKGNNILNQQIKYIHLGRLQLILQLHRTGFFKSHEIEVVQLVEYVWEAYRYKLYLQDSSVVLISLTLNDVSARNPELFREIVSTIGTDDDNPAQLFLKMATNKFVEGGGGGASGPVTKITHESVLRALENSKNYYPLLNPLIYLVVEECREDEALFDKVVNLANYMLQSSSFNSVKVGLMTLVTIFFQVKSEERLRQLFGKLDTFFRIVAKIYRYPNTSNMKKFINKYILMLSKLLARGSFFDHEDLPSGIYSYLASSVGTVDAVNDDIVVYMDLFNKIFGSFLTVFNSAGLQKTSGTLDPDTSLKYELLFKIGEYVNSGTLTIFTPIIKSLLSNIQLKSAYVSKNEGAEVRWATADELCTRLLAKFRSDGAHSSYVLHLIKFTASNSFSSTSLLLRFINELHAGDHADHSEGPLGEIEEELLKLYLELLTKHLSNLVNKFCKLGCTELNHYSTVLQEQVQLLSVSAPESTPPKDDPCLNLKTKLLGLVHTGNLETIVEIVAPAEVLRRNIVILTLALYLDLAEEYDLAHESLRYAASVHKYLTRSPDFDQNEKEEFYHMLIHLFFTGSPGDADACDGPEDNALWHLLYLLNWLVWKQLLPNFAKEAWELALRITFTCDLTQINYSSDEDTDHSDEPPDPSVEVTVDSDRACVRVNKHGEHDGCFEGVDSDQEEPEDESAEEHSGDDYSDHERSPVTPKRTYAELSLGEDEDDESDVILDDYDEIYKELTDHQAEPPHRRDRKALLDPNSKIKEIGYSLLLSLVEDCSEAVRNEGALTLTDLFSLVREHSSSLKTQYHGKIVRLIKHLAGYHWRHKSGDAPERERSELSSEEMDTVNKIVIKLLYNKNSRAIFMDALKIMDWIVKEDRVIALIANYTAFVALSKRTNASLSTLLELYRHYPCLLNLFNFMETTHKNLARSQVLLLYADLVHTNNYYTATDHNDTPPIHCFPPDFVPFLFGKSLDSDLGVLAKLVQFNAADGGASANFSTQYLKSLAKCVNRVNQYVAKNDLLSTTVLESLNLINTNVDLIKDKRIRKYFNVQHFKSDRLSGKGAPQPI